MFYQTRHLKFDKCEIYIEADGVKLAFRPTSPRAFIEHDKLSTNRNEGSNKKAFPYARGRETISRH